MAYPQYDLVIISPECFSEVLRPLQEHKNQTALSTEIIILEDIIRNYNGRDEAEKIKSCLASYRRRNGIRYAMLIGDSEIFPVRYAKTDRTNPVAFNTAFYATDLYYSNLFKFDGSFDDWDYNNNGYFGELQGSTTPGILNLDSIDLRPDIAVGRIPASTVEEVEYYVQKVIRYESSGSNNAWYKRSLLLANNEWDPDACKIQESVAKNSLKGFTNYKLYADPNPCRDTPDLNAENINDRINKGVGFVGYVGHGKTNEWEDCYKTENIKGLTNESKLPVMIAIACDTSKFSTSPPYGPYTDIHGQDHAGADHGEVFTSIPPQPACIQTVLNPESLGESIIAKHKVGAIGYVGSITGVQEWARDLIKYFFAAVRMGHETLGGMWNFMFNRYYESHIPPLAVNPPNWKKVSEFRQPWKFLLFGDPSLRLGGIQPGPREDCIRFDYTRASIMAVGFKWKIVIGNHYLLDFGMDAMAAVKALKIIRHYKFNQMCYVGRPRPSMEYFLSDGKPPVDKIGDEDSIAFNPASITPKFVRGRWRIVDGNSWLLDFGFKESEAKLAYRIIQKYGFNHICFVGRPNAKMTYFRR